MDNPIMGLVTIFIGISILLAIGVSILSNTSSAFDCKELDGYNTNNKTYTEGTWGHTCNEIHTSTQNSIGLLVVILVVVAAIAILVVVRML